MTESDFSERRRFPRVSVNFAATFAVQTPKQVDAQECPVVTIGEGGCFLQTKLTHVKDTDLTINFTFQGLEVQARGKVAYAVPYVKGSESVQFPGMGVEFTEISEDVRSKIRAFVAEERLKKGL